ncbi:dentin sialophosphoprotein isoform X2 [Cephus cinctus]|uniref:Dentin sialophosphoprotein isoform X2 n=1 Tax=Cephus cinctus TaxID=211228 RepID=A0AAJ7BKW2_CEPCN|nr:dentin sialophosphoprotein isoform X2 [Cephus cinctus]
MNEDSRMFSEVEQNTEVVVAAEHAARKISRTHIMELCSTSNANNESSSTRCAVMAQQNEEVTVHHGPHGILLNCRRITAIGQYSVPQAGYLNVPEALFSGSSYIGHTNPLIALNNQSHIINMNIERPIPNNINATNFMCMNNVDLNNNPGYLNTQIVIMPQLINNQIRQPVYISNTGNAIAAPMIESREPEVVVLSDDSDENGKCLALPSDGNSDNDTSQEQISLQNSVKDTDSNTTMDSNDESNGLSEFITISKSNNTISKEIQNDSEDVILNDINENLSISKSNDNISNMQTLSPLSESSNLSRASKSTKLSSSPSILSLNLNDSFLSRTSCSQQCDKRFSEMLSIESNVNFDKSKDNVLAKNKSFEDIQDFNSERSEESNDDQICVDLESPTSYTVDDTVSTFVENKVADDLVEILTGLDSSSEEDRWLIHSKKVMRTMSEQPNSSEYNFDYDNTSVCADKNEETEKRNSESKSEEEDVIYLKTLNVTMEPSEYKKDACYFKEFLKLEYASIDSQESKLSPKQENIYRDVKCEDGNVSSEETNMDLSLDSCYHGLFKRNVIRPSTLNPSYSNQTLLENDIRTMFISVKHERDIRRKSNKKGEKVIVRAPVIMTENRLDKISSTESSKRTTKNPVLSTDSNNLVTPFTSSGVNRSIAIADNSNVKKRTSQLHELRNQSNPYSRSSRPSLEKRSRKRKSAGYKMEDSLVSHPDDFLEYSSQDERRLEQENHSQLKVLNREKLGQLKSDNSKNLRTSFRRLQDLVSQAGCWLQGTTIRGRTRSQSRSEQKEVNEKKDSRRNSHDTISTRIVVEAPKNKRKQSKSESPKIRNSKKSDGPKKSVAKKIKMS